MSGREIQDGKDSKYPSNRRSNKFPEAENSHPIQEGPNGESLINRLPVDPVEAAKQQIDHHEKITGNRSALAKGISFLNPEEERSLANLKLLTASYEMAKKTGDSQATEKIKEELVRQIEKDIANLTSHEEFCRYGTGFLKTTGLFMRGKSGFAGTAIAYALDQIKPNDPLGIQALDGSLGLVKGLSLRGIFNRLGEAPVSIAAKGVGLGIASRFAETALDRKTYINAEGQLQLDEAARTLGHSTFSTGVLATDVTTFGLSHGLVKFANGITGGIITSSPIASSMATAFSFGLLSGLHLEVQRQTAEGKTFANFDYGQIIRTGTIQGSLDSIAGAAGGLQAHHAQRQQLKLQHPQFKDNALKLEPHLATVSMKNSLSGTFDQLVPHHLANISTKPNLPELWEPTRDVTRLSAAERKELISHVHSRLFNREHVHEFARTLLSVTSSWNTDFSPRAKLLGEHFKTYQQAVAKVKEQIVDAGHLPISDFQTSEKAKAALADKPQLWKLYDEYVQARDTYAQELSLLNKQRDERALALEQAVASFAQARGLPAIKIRLYDNLGAAGAAYRLGDGTLRLKRTDLDNRKNVQGLSSSVYHELTHAEQDTLVIRYLADQIGIDKQANLQQLSELNRLYKLLTKHDLDKAWLENIRHVRRGVKLTPTEHEHAKLLSQAFNDLHPIGAIFGDLGNHFRLAQRALLELPKPNGGYILVDKLMNDRKGTLSEHWFGTKEPPEAVRPLFADWQKFQTDPQAPWDHARAQTILSNLLNIRLAEINKTRQELYAAYIKGLHEKEAWATGELARLATMNLLRRP